jgi:hypothetical protein
LKRAINIRCTLQFLYFERKKYFYLTLCPKNFKYENIKTNCVKKYTFNKKRSEEFSRNVCSADLKDSLGKEELYLRKIFKKMMFEIIIVAIRNYVYCIIKTNYLQIYMKKQEAT